MAKKIVRVVGHKNPDTDSICSAICYADLKNKITNESRQHQCRDSICAGLF